MRRGTTHFYALMVAIDHNSCH